MTVSRNEGPVGAYANTAARESAASFDATLTYDISPELPQAAQEEVMQVLGIDPKRIAYQSLSVVGSNGRISWVTYSQVQLGEEMTEEQRQAIVAIDARFSKEDATAEPISFEVFEHLSKTLGHDKTKEVMAALDTYTPKEQS